MNNECELHGRKKAWSNLWLAGLCAEIQDPDRGPHYCIELHDSAHSTLQQSLLSSTEFIEQTPRHLPYITPCTLVDMYRRFVAACYFSLRGRYIQSTPTTSLQHTCPYRCHLPSPIPFCSLHQNLVYSFLFLCALYPSPGEHRGNGK